METKSVTSADGTTIGYDQHGEGPPVICLHGSGVTRQMWMGLARLLEDDATLMIPDRRGRGASGDAETWSFEQERADVAALAETLDEPPVLFGSSYGGLLAMAAAQDLSVAGLVLYEPPLPKLTVDMAEHESLAGRMEPLLEEGKREAAVKLFFKEATGADNIEHWPIWPECVELAETIVREGYVVGDFDPADVEVAVPALLLTGDRSPGYLQDGVDILKEEIANNRVVEIEGAGHAGVVTAPGDVAAAVREFLDDSVL